METHASSPARASLSSPQPFERASVSITSQLKARQAAKMRELKEVLVHAGYCSLDQQAAALGIARSTAWSVLKGNHKSSGLSAALMKRMLLRPELPLAVRCLLVQYIHDRIAGLHGHNRSQLRRFTNKLSPQWLGFKQSSSRLSKDLMAERPK